MLHSAFTRMRDYITPTNNTSTFTTTGELTPEEFVLAGDYLVYKFPTWSWSSAPQNCLVPYLPADKQYLLLKRAPCHSRLDDTFSTWDPDADIDTDSPHPTHPAPTEEDDSDSEIPDSDSDSDSDSEALKPSKLSRGTTSRAPLRYYNIYLTYGSYFRTPR